MKTPKVRTLVVTIFIGALLVVFNFFTLKTTSALRAFINTESYYSGGQKDATRQLYLYAFTSDNLHWSQFQEHLKIPIGDSLARVALNDDASREVINSAFIQGKNSPQDLDDLVWLYRNFKDFKFMQSALGYWSQCDRLVGELYQLGRELNVHVERETLTNGKHFEILYQLERNSQDLSRNQKQFSAVMSNATRSLSSFLFWANFMMTFGILGTAGYLILFSFRKVRQSKYTLQHQVEKLTKANFELDRFVYSVSHDLRAPLASIQGIIKVARHENKSESENEMLNMIGNSANRLDLFIKDILDYSRNSRMQITHKAIDFEKSISETLENLSHMENFDRLKIESKIEGEGTFFSDDKRLDIVISNIISNAIKYLDVDKDNPFLSICIKWSGTDASLIFKDNGIGIRENQLQKIFDMFYRASNQATGAGLGLYILKETVENVGGKFNVDSEFEKGITFSIDLPSMQPNETNA